MDDDPRHAALLTLLQAAPIGDETTWNPPSRQHGLSPSPAPADAEGWRARLDDPGLRTEALPLPEALASALGALRLSLAGVPGFAIELTARDGQPLDVAALPGAAAPLDGGGQGWLWCPDRRGCGVMTSAGIGLALRLDVARGLALQALRDAAPAPARVTGTTSSAVTQAVDIKDAIARCLQLGAAHSTCDASDEAVLYALLADRWAPEPADAAAAVANLIGCGAPTPAPGDVALADAGPSGRARLRRLGLRLTADLTRQGAESSRAADPAVARVVLEALRAGLARHDGASALDHQLARADAERASRPPRGWQPARWHADERVLAPMAWWVAEPQ